MSDRYTTREVREQERAAIAATGGLSRQKAGAVSARSAKAAMEARTLRPDQAEAFEHAIGAGHLKLIEGRAGTGKSYTLAAIRDAYERDGNTWWVPREPERDRERQRQSRGLGMGR